MKEQTELERLADRQGINFDPFLDDADSGPRRSRFRDAAGHRFQFQDGQFSPLVGTVTGISSERFPQGEGCWTTSRHCGFH